MRMVLAYIGVGLASERPYDPGLDSNATAWWFAIDTKEISYFNDGVWITFGKAIQE